MALSLDRGREVRDYACGSCGRPYQQVTGFVLRDGDAYAVYYAQCHGHARDGPEVWLDLILGTWEGPAYPDHLAFSCCVTIDGVRLVDAPTVVEGRAPFFGQKLSRQEALAHERLSDAHEVVDYIVTTDLTVGEYLYGAAT